MVSKYRNGVCAVIRRKSDNSVLVCHRINYDEREGWQFPQGGIEENADIIDELKRELREEIGTDKVSIVKISKKSTKYDFPKNLRFKYYGQIHKWVLCYLDGSDDLINFNYTPAEFDDFKWVTPDEALDLIVDFKKQAYLDGLKELGLL